MWFSGLVLHHMISVLSIALFFLDLYKIIIVSIGSHLLKSMVFLPWNRLMVFYI